MSIALAFAPHAEQDRIVTSVESEAVSLRTTIDRSRREIGLVRGYRTRLIADVVTGKREVRRAMTRLPDEPDGPRRRRCPTDAVDGTADDLDPVPEEAEA